MKKGCTKVPFSRCAWCVTPQTCAEAGYNFTWAKWRKHYAECIAHAARGQRAYYKEVFCLSTTLVSLASGDILQAAGKCHAGWAGSVQRAKGKVQAMCTENKVDKVPYEFAGVPATSSLLGCPVQPVGCTMQPIGCIIVTTKPTPDTVHSPTPGQLHVESIQLACTCALCCCYALCMKREELLIFYSFWLRCFVVMMQYVDFLG